MSCQQCEDAPCINVCPVKAISRDENLDYVKIDYDICIGCRACVSACPFGAMSFDVIGRKVVKCDLCDGDPQCVRFCEVKALEYVDADRVSVVKKKDAAYRLSVAEKEAAALAAQV
jgi:Fe-S-cluster-containing hydrogenase component 2